MEHAKILDCTLRDGAYLIDKNFGEETIKGIIENLVNARIDFIEIGFFQDEGFGKGKTVYRNSLDAKRFIPEDKKKSKFTVLADYSRFSIENLDDHRKDSIDAIRECFFKQERFDAINVCRQIKEKGYQVFVQPVDILGYSDKELIELIERINEVEPYCVSIVDTFGSMYQEDLYRVYEIINQHLIPTCKIGFHSHNNLQLSSSLSQEFLRISKNARNVIVDGTLNGMGRGAGNTPTELIAQYMISKMGYSYDIDFLLDAIDSYVNNIRKKCEWGYTTQYYIAGTFSAHVNNISYLCKKNSINSKDIRFILNKVSSDARKRYDYGGLEKIYLDLLSANIDDAEAYKKLQDIFKNKEVLLIAPGSSVLLMQEKIETYIKAKHPVVITVNFIHENINSDYIFVSNVKRFNYFKHNKKFIDTPKICTSNLKITGEKIYKISFRRLIKCGWEHLDNSTLMALRFLNDIGVKRIRIAGFDGYENESKVTKNYLYDNLEIHFENDNPMELNEEIREMLEDFAQTKTVPVSFLTPSRFETCFNGDL